MEVRALAPLLEDRSPACPVLDVSLGAACVRWPRPGGLVSRVALPRGEPWAPPRWCEMGACRPASREGTPVGHPPQRPAPKGVWFKTYFAWVFVP